MDLLIPEIFKTLNAELGPILCKVFNFIFNTGVCLESWSKGIIVPVSKKGNLNDVNNYRALH